jgi:hypothetical protein
LISGLNAFSQRAAERLFQAHPEWKDLARADTGALTIEIASPTVGRSLLIVADDDELTIYFQPFAWHEHFGPFLGIDFEEFMDLAVEEIDLILHDQTVIAEHSCSGTWLGSSSFLITDPEQFRPKKSELIRLRSWTGRHDRELSGQ